ncbi:embryogenesis-like protein [Corylus avellana]|uniref:embryogenesis-like protein n=1 Tax=Corylus avellana TaxID=13451 RepID=UPI001E21CEF4|nr:embryogenesis-like protein [Corylus avellana]XP_059454305.1 embryogenesis-like protein [Corylus avellana]XP_059454307.1 embryogenesis-like protein [Corylus avellana]
MHQRSQFSLCKLFCRHHFQRFPLPSSSFSLNSLAAVSIQLVPGSVLFPRPKFSITPTSSFHHLPHPTLSNSQTQLRKYSAAAGDSVAELDKNKEVDMINLKFAEAREEIEMAMESKETVYFDEEAECARAAANEVVEMFDGLLAKLPESERAALRRSMGLKIEQLKAELQQLNE